MMVHAFHPSAQEAGAEAGIFFKFPGKLGLHSKTLPKTKQIITFLF